NHDLLLIFRLRWINLSVLRIVLTFLLLGVIQAWRRSRWKILGQPIDANLSRFPRPGGPTDCSHARKGVGNEYRSESSRGAAKDLPTNLSPLRGSLPHGNVYPRLTPWATLLRPSGPEKPVRCYIQAQNNPLRREIDDFATPFSATSCCHRSIVDRRLAVR